MKKKDLKKAVKEGYGRIAKEGSSCCYVPECCSPRKSSLANEISKKIGYSEEELRQAPEGANLGLGCGNPVALASLKEGETVLDLGSGLGLDCFLASQKVGKAGKVIGIDMTPEMIKKARENAKKGEYQNVEFRLGEIENLPVAENSVDVIISNCVINLSLDKKSAFKEAYRVLKPGGRISISDIVLLKELPEFIKNSIEAYIGCVSGAILKAEYIEAIKEAGFQEIKIIEETKFPVEYITNDPTAKTMIEHLKVTPEIIKEIGSSVISIKICGVKPIVST